MPTAILAPQHLSAKELDRYLARGWRPLGQRIYTADFIQLELGAIFSVIPTRLELADHQWRKGQRKLLRRNKQAFEITYGPAQLTAEKKRVNDLYLLEQPTKSTADLSIHLIHDDRKIFNTREICIYHNKKLVAFSFYDCGETSVYSKAGIYDPAYHQFSLGMFTMYLEVEWCMQAGYSYYYPGYISPDVPLFDYKCRVGNLHFWNLQAQNWLPMAELDPVVHAPLRVLHQNILAIRHHLRERGVQTQSFEYIFFEMRLMYENDITYLDQPFFLLVHCPVAQKCWIITYDLSLGCYQCWEAYFEQRITFFEQQKDRNWPLFKYVLQLQRSFFQSTDMAKIGEAVLDLLDGQEPILSPKEY